ncbi:hypothetical Protein YC6258_04285 [Gynuella sunshinyii YC6258]|uniref:Uncharacterized protein n=1 Tax=Gynuella sunshinyii YC6258 TaxID=1445510 RepID=A0A0C5W0W4_9GAMM|nr:hypothetical Protein YC6258_04285 [Gynuella sunshinyii YC6258]
MDGTGLAVSGLLHQLTEKSARKQSLVIRVPIITAMARTAIGIAGIFGTA